jgi:hypothetical protein
MAHEVRVVLEHIMEVISCIVSFVICDMSIASVKFFADV